MLQEPWVYQWAEAIEPTLTARLYQLAKEELTACDWNHQLSRNEDRNVLRIGQDGYGNPLMEYSWTSDEDLRCHTPEHGFTIYDIQDETMEVLLKKWEITEDGEDLLDDNLDFDNLPHCFQAEPRLPRPLPMIEQQSFLLPTPATLLGTANLTLSQRITMNLAAELSEYMDPQKLDAILNLAKCRIKAEAAAEKAILETIENPRRRMAVEDHYWETETSLDTQSPEVQAHHRMKQEKAAELDNRWSLQEDPTGPQDIVTLAGDACRTLMAEAINQDCLSSLVERSRQPLNQFINPYLKPRLDDYRDLARNYEALQVIRQTNPGLYHLYLDRRADRSQNKENPQQILETLRGRGKQRLNRSEWLVFNRLADLNIQKHHFNRRLREMRELARIIATAKRPECEDADLLTAATSTSLMKLWNNQRLIRRTTERWACTTLLRAFLKPGGERKTGPTLNLLAHATKQMITCGRQWKEAEWPGILQEHHRWHQERTRSQRKYGRRIRGILVPEYEHLGCTIIPMGSRGELRDATRMAWGKLREFLEMMDYEQPFQRDWDRNIRCHLVTNDEHGQLAVITVRTGKDGIWRTRQAITPPRNWGNIPLDEIENELGRRYRQEAGQPDRAPPRGSKQ